MSKKSKTYVRLLTYVMRAIADLNEDKGSTTPRIMEQVQRAFNVSNAGDMKPKSLAALVKRALKYGVNVGVLRLSSGKYRLSLGQPPGGTCAVKATKERRTRKRRDKFRKNLKKNKRLLGKRHDNKRLCRDINRKDRILRLGMTRKEQKKKCRLLGKAFLKKSRMEKR